MGVSEINLEAFKRWGLLTRGAKSENLQCVSLGGTVKSLNLYHQFRLCPGAHYRRDKVYPRCLYVCLSFNKHLPVTTHVPTTWKLQRLPSRSSAVHDQQWKSLPGPPHPWYETRDAGTPSTLEGKSNLYDRIHCPLEKCLQRMDFPTDYVCVR